MNVVVIEIKPYLKDIINNLQKYDTKKIWITIAINISSSRDTDKAHSKGVNIEIMIYDKADKVIKNLFESLLYRNHRFVQKNHLKVLILSLIVLIYGITNVIKEIQIVVDQIQISLIG